MCLLVVLFLYIDLLSIEVFPKVKEMGVIKLVGSKLSFIHTPKSYCCCIVGTELQFGAIVLSTITDTPVDFEVERKKKIHANFCQVMQMLLTLKDLKATKRYLRGG